jgi:long-chain acyl-CoA synthetase
MKEHQHIDFTRVFDILSYQQQKYPQRHALNEKQNGRWQHYSIEDVIQQTNRVSCWLIENGYEKGDRVAVMPKMGSHAWLIIDFACQQVGLILVPIHPTSTIEEVTFILNESEVNLFRN